jgi:hypothetical protein
MFSNTFPDKAKIAETVASHAAGNQGGAFQRHRALQACLGTDEPGLYRLPQADFLPAHPLRGDGFRRRHDPVAKPASSSSTAWPAARPRAFPSPPSSPSGLALPMIYVRKKPKGHGRNAQIEGELREGFAGAGDRGPDHGRRIDVHLHRRHPRGRLHRRSRHCACSTTGSLKRPEGAVRQRRGRAALSRHLARCAGGGDQAEGLRSRDIAIGRANFLDAPLEMVGASMAVFPSCPHSR